MLIKTLVENTSISKDFGSEHGLSLYVETKKHKILFDVGASDLFLQNAKKLNVNIADVDFLVISHGHYDHGGGLKTFLKENTKAEVFLHRLAFEKHYAIRPNDELEFVGLDEDLKQNKQIILTSDRFFINSGIQVFSNICLLYTSIIRIDGICRKLKGGEKHAEKRRNRSNGCGINDWKRIRALHRC